MEKMVELYYRNNAKKLHDVVDKLLLKSGFAGLVDNEDFYSLANEVFVDVIRRYDASQSFHGFLYCCLNNKFKSEMTKRNRQKRQADRMAISMDSPVGDDENCTLGDIIADEFNIEEELFEENEEGYSQRMLQYLGRLSNLQREILKLTVAGYTSGEIINELHITGKQYADCNEAIHAYRNVSILF